MPNSPMQFMALVAAVLGMIMLSGCQPASQANASQDSDQGQVRTYYIAAEDVVWDYAPSGMNLITGEDFDEFESTITVPGDYNLGSEVKKALYFEYTDDTFTTRVERSSEWEHLGWLGPLIRAEVGDTIRIVFRNNTSFPASLHPHGVFYNKDSEGAPYQDNTSGSDKADDGVPPGEIHVYEWGVPERAGPPPGGASTAFWMYHSHADEVRDFNTGLVGPMLITARGRSADETLRPDDVDREIIVAFFTTEEASSHYIEENVNTYLARAEDISYGRDPFNGHAILWPGGGSSIFRDNMNGFIYGNLPMITVNQDERVRWYLMAGTGFEIHAPHWHGNTGVEGNMRVDTIDLVTMGMSQVDMVPDAAGVWLFHCHVSNHMISGMMGRYEVLPTESSD